ncbi:MAG: hypothetical protein JRE40_15270 [Deltaproteobacteria bacterium]|nr:hypothetical protein [Deltaproteobacteria bacterium]
MALRKPLVMVSGQITQLSASDTLDAVVQEVEVITATNSNAGAIVIGMPVYVDGAGTVDKAQADASGTKKLLGLVTDVTVATAATATIQTEGILAATTGQWDAIAGTTGGLTAGSVYFLDAATAGNLTETAPSTATQFIVPCGLALSTLEIQILHELDIAL